MAKGSPIPPTDHLIGTLLRAREQAMSLNEHMAAYLIGMAIKSVEDRQAEGVPPGWDDGIDEAVSDAATDDTEDDPAPEARSAA